MFLGLTVGSTVVTDILTPPFEFPSVGYGVPVRIGQVTYNNSTKSTINMTTENNKIATDETTTEYQNKISRQLNNFTSQSIHFVANISNNFTENHIENKYYTNQIEKSWFSVLTFSIILVMVLFVLGCSTLCMKQVQK